MTRDEIFAKLKEFGPLVTPEKFYEKLSFWLKEKFPATVGTISVGWQHTLIVEHLAMMFTVIHDGTVYYMGTSYCDAPEGSEYKHIPTIDWPDTFNMPDMALKPAYGTRTIQLHENVDFADPSEVMPIIEDFYARCKNGMV